MRALLYCVRELAIIFRRSRKEEPRLEWVGEQMTSSIIDFWMKYSSASVEDEAEKAFRSFLLCFAQFSGVKTFHEPAKHWRDFLWLKEKRQQKHQKQF